MSIGTYSLNKTVLLWLVSATVFVALASIGIWLHNVILNSHYEKQRLYTTAIKTENKDEFNYSIDTKQGNVLAYGNFEFQDLVKFREMNKKFAYVKKVKQVYTRHSTTSCNSNGSCSTSTYYSWDWHGQEIKESKTVKFMDREYPKSLFNHHFSQYRHIDASEIIKGETERCWYPNRIIDWMGFEVKGNTRYCYTVIDSVLTGSILVNTYNGTLEPAEGNNITIYNQTIDERVIGAQNTSIILKWLFIIVWTILTIVATIGFTYWWTGNLI